MVLERSWDLVPVLDDADQARTLLEVPDNGYELCILWAAVPDHARRLSGSVGSERTTVTRVDPGTGERVRFSRARTAEEDDEVSELVNEFLAEARIPARPGRHRWFLVPPGDVTDFGELVALVMQRHGSDESAPNVLRAAEDVFRDLY
ncbi:hypothetical protein BJF78_12875 [Pseudonocardia sp. CNS-139]|nr:hypothetical protein BJF78_12875 [Pseudonocardia sp. CNS-139]